MKVTAYGICHSISYLLVYHHFRYFFLGKLENCTLEAWNVIFLIGLILGILGARIMKCLEGHFSWREMPQIYRGGLSSYGSWYICLYYIWLVSRFYQIDTIALLECITVSTSIISIFVRLGNYFNNELPGIYLPTWEMRYPSQLHNMVTEGILMTIIYHSLMDTIGRGYIYLVVSTVYPFIRFINEYFKEDEIIVPHWYRQWFPRKLKFAQFQSVCFSIVSLLTFRAMGYFGRHPLPG